MERLRVILNTVCMRTRGRRPGRLNWHGRPDCRGRPGLPLRRVAALAAAMVVGGTVLWLPASRPTPSEGEGERFGPIHWYEPMEQK